MADQMLLIRNTTASALEIMIEPRPDRYVLQPGDEMAIEAGLDGAPFDVSAFEGGLQIYTGMDPAPVVKVNGRPAQQDWATGSAPPPIS